MVAQTRPEFHLGEVRETARSEIEWGSIVGLVTIPGGDVIVADGIQGRLVRLDTSLEDVVWSVGRRGQGPAEFSRIGGIWLASGGVVVFDEGNARVARYSFDGELVAVKTLSSIGPGRVLAVSRRGAAWFARRETLPVEEGVQRPNWETTIFRLESDSLAVGPTLSGPESTLIEYEGAFLIGSVPFARNTFVAAGDSSFAVLENGEPYLEVWRDNGSGPIALVPIPFPTRSITERDEEEYIRRVAGDTPKRSEDYKRIRNAQERFMIHGTYPAATGIVESGPDTWWLKIPDIQVTENRWCRLAIPRSEITCIDIEGNVLSGSTKGVLVREEAENGSPVIVEYELVFDGTE